MAALHAALQSLGPTDFSTVPTDQLETKDYLQHLFAQAKTIIDSVPPPTEVPSTPARSRSNTTTSSVSSASDLSASSARSDPIDPANVSLQKEWSKPMKLGARENPLSISVYKLGGKDGRGAWFARRSVHEGMGYRKWKLGLQREFPETMEVQGGPGEVYHLSAQFPGPTTPRDFVEMLVTSSTALDAPAAPQTSDSTAKRAPRNFMVISKPCIHPECPPRDGFVRGQYESVEFIREIPVKPTKSSSTTNLQQLRHSSTAPLIEKAALIRSAQHSLDRGGSGEEMLADMDADGHVPIAKDVLVQEGRKRGKTISFAESRGVRAKGEAMDTPHDEGFDDPAEQNPVEWIMITRSDPGGSVPRFLVERGTPSGIVSDASKFLHWACKKEHPVENDYAEKSQEVDQDIARKSSQSQVLEQYQTNGHLAGLAEEVPESGESSVTLTNGNMTHSEHFILEPGRQEGIISTLANAAVAGIESYAPQAVMDHLLGHRSENTASSWLPNNPETQASTGMDNTTEAQSIASTSDAASFASAEEGFNDASSISPQSVKSFTKSSPGQTRHDRELAKLEQRKKALDDQLARTREKEAKDKEELTSKEEDRIRKAEEKHAREVSKHEQRYHKEVAKIEAKRAKDEQKEVERKKKAEEKDEKMKLMKERDAARTELEQMRKERELLREQAGALQRENTALVARIGKLEMGKKMLGEVQAEIESGGRSRSSSLRKKKGESMNGSGLEATVLAGDKGL
ncbi:MAG: hypothetical protein Q9179_005242 [Wetmoreana sp. 5 TL-2023]